EGGGPAPAPSNTTSVQRGAAGCTDTDQNAADFGPAAATPAPRNTATAPNPCPSNQPVVADCDGPLSTVSGVAASTVVRAADADGTVTSVSITQGAPAP